MSNYTKLGTLTKIKTGKLDANASSADGIYPFFTCSREPLKINSYSYDCECVLVAGNGELNVKYYKGKFDAYQRTYIIEVSDNNVLLPKYLYYFLDLYVETLRLQSIGGIIKYIKLGNLTEAEIPLFSIEEQQNIVNQLDKCKNLIEQRKLQLQKLDNLVKSQFIEMFGDAIKNDKYWVTYSLNYVAPAIAYKGKITPQDNKFWLLNLDMVEAQTGDIISKVMVNQEQIGNSTIAFNEDNILYSKLRPYLNKVVIPYERGFATSELVPLKPQKDYLNRIFFATLLRSDAFVGYIQEQVAGAKMPRVSMDVFRNFKVICPPLSLQNEFANFVEQTDKSKVLLEKSATIIMKLINLIFYLVYIEKSNVLCYNIHSTEEL